MHVWAAAHYEAEASARVPHHKDAPQPSLQRTYKGARLMPARRAWVTSARTRESDPLLRACKTFQAHEIGVRSALPRGDSVAGVCKEGRTR